MLVTLKVRKWKTSMESTGLGFDSEKSICRRFTAQVIRDLAQLVHERTKPERCIS